jgi:phage terminase large subunit-like protein
MDAWKRCSGPPRRLVDWECWIGLDLSKKTDLTAMVCAFPNEDGSIDLLPFFWLPEARIHEIEKSVHADLQGWRRRDLLETTPGNVLDYVAVRKSIGNRQRFCASDGRSRSEWLRHREYRHLIEKSPGN